MGRHWGHDVALAARLEEFGDRESRLPPACDLCPECRKARSGWRSARAPFGRRHGERRSGVRRRQHPLRPRRHLWSAGSAGGLLRVRFPERAASRPVRRPGDPLIERYRQQDGLMCLALLEEARGQPLGAREQGPRSLSIYEQCVPVSVPAHFGELTLLPGENGDVWVASASGDVSVAGQPGPRRRAAARRRRPSPFSASRTATSGGAATALSGVSVDERIKDLAWADGAGGLDPGSDPRGGRRPGCVCTAGFNLTLQRRRMVRSVADPAGQLARGPSASFRDVNYSTPEQIAEVVYEAATDGKDRCVMWQAPTRRRPTRRACRSAARRS